MTLQIEAAAFKKRINSSCSILVGGIQNQADNDIQLFPNPAKNEIVVGLDQLKSNCVVAIEIYDLQGRKIESRTTSASSLTIDLRYYAVGNYLIRVAQQTKMYQKQFVKE